MIDWISEIISNSFWQSLDIVFDEFFDFIFKCINWVIIQPTEPGKYITKFNEYLAGVQFFAGGLLVIFVVLAVFRQISGVMYTSEKSIGTYFIHVTFAGALIYILPKTVTIIFLPINNALIGFIGYVGIDATRLKDSFLDARLLINQEGKILTIMFLILIIALFAMAIAGAIRYIETLIAILIAPLVALSVINNSDGLQVWIREVIAIVFTQTIHFLILQMLLSIMAGVESITIVILLSIGCIVVGLKGPQILRQYLYKTGTSSALVSAAGSTGRIGMMGMMFKR